MIESDWNLTLSTLQRIDQGIRICNDALFATDFGLWMRGLYHLYGELSTWMNEEEQTTFLKLLSPCKNWQGQDIPTNIDYFMIATQSLRRTAHKNKLLLREAEDTMKHGGA